MFSKKSTAKSALEHHLTELDSINSTIEGNTWKASLKDTLDLYVGPNSSISKRLDDIFFTRRESVSGDRDVPSFSYYVYDDSKKSDFKVLIKNAVKYVEANGVYKDPSRKNFLSNWDNIQLWPVIGAVAVSILFVGMYFGKMEKDREILEFESKARSAELRYENSVKEIELLKKQIAEKSLNSQPKIKDPGVVKR